MATIDPIVTQNLTTAEREARILPAGKYVRDSEHGIGYLGDGIIYGGVPLSPAVIDLTGEGDLTLAALALGETIGGYTIIKNVKYKVTLDGTDTPVSRYGFMTTLGGANTNITAVGSPGATCTITNTTASPFTESMVGLVLSAGGYYYMITAYTSSTTVSAKLSYAGGTMTSQSNVQAYISVPERGIAEDYIIHYSELEILTVDSALRTAVYMPDFSTTNLMLNGWYVDGVMTGINLYALNNNNDLWFRSHTSRFLEMGDAVTVSSGSGLRYDDIRFPIVYSNTEYTAIACHNSTAEHFAKSMPTISNKTVTQARIGVYVNDSLTFAGGDLSWETKGKSAS